MPLPRSRKIAPQKYVKSLNAFVFAWVATENALHHLLDKIKEATKTLMVLVSRWYGINMPAIIEVAEEQLAPVEPSPTPTLAAEATIDVEHFQDEDVMTLQKTRELWEVAQINLNTLGIFLKRVGV